MRSFQNNFIHNHPITHRILTIVRHLGEYRGKQDLYKEQSPQMLETLRQTAIIQSVESSNRLEGITAPHKRIKEIVQQKTTPENRSEQEIAGYRDVLNMIHSYYDGMEITSGLILQFHRDLYKYIPGKGGKWKSTDNEIIEKLPDGTNFIRFKPVPAFLTSESMDNLNRCFNEIWQSGEIEPLLLIPAYILDFLCIHPFGDGNGRTARLLSLLLLYKAGYEVGKYISLEKTVEETRESYYETLFKSSQGWHKENHSLLPWWEYFLGVMMQGAYGEFESRVGIITSTRGAKTDMVITAIENQFESFTISDIERLCPGVSRPTIHRTLKKLKEQGKITCLSSGRNATWKRI